MSLISKTAGAGKTALPAANPDPAIARSARPDPILPPSPPAGTRGSTPWFVHVLALLGILIGAGGVYLAWETKKQSEQQIQAADQKIESTEKNLADLRTSHEESRITLEKKIQEDTGKLRIQLESAEIQVKKLEEESQVVSRELQVIGTLKTQQQNLESRLDAVDKSSRDTRQRLEVTQAGLEDLKKKALKASISPQEPGSRVSPVGMKLYLTRDSLGAIASRAGIAGAPEELAESWKKLFSQPAGDSRGQKIQTAVAQSAVATGVVGADGAAEMQKVPPGDYFLLGATGQGGGFVYEKKVKVDKNSGDLILSSEDSANN